jgi:hypothetical protein
VTEHAVRRRRVRGLAGCHIAGRFFAGRKENSIYELETPENNLAAVERESSREQPSILGLGESADRRRSVRWMGAVVEEPMNQLDRIAKEYLAARRIIATALGEWYGGSPERLNAKAEAIIARLAAHDPPILLDMQDEEKPDSR